MAPTVFANGWRRTVEERLASGELSVAAIKELLDYISGPDFPHRDLPSTVAQPYGRSQLDLYDAAAFDEVLAFLRGGFLGLGYVELGAPPGKDREVELNNQILSSIPPVGISARFAGGAGDSDGVFEWHRPLPVTQHREDAPQATAWLRPSQLPLEVGHTQAETTLWHLRVDAGLVRWPYRSTRLTIIALLGNPVHHAPGTRPWRTLAQMDGEPPLTFWQPDPQFDPATFD